MKRVFTLTFTAANGKLMVNSRMDDRSKLREQVFLIAQIMNQPQLWTDFRAILEWIANSSVSDLYFTDINYSLTIQVLPVENTNANA